MKRIVSLLLLAAALAGECFAQASGGVGYAQSGSGRARAEANERAKRATPQGEQPPSATSMFVDASVLMDATVAEFTAGLRQLGVKAEDVYVDFASQNKIYAYQIAGDVAREKLAGFELKKNVAVHYRDRDLLDKLTVFASRSKIYDLIKVDYIVRDTAAVENRLMEEATKIIEQKSARYQRLLGIRLRPPAQVYAEKPSIYFPTEMYDSYAAYESEEIGEEYYRQKYTVQNARKSRTFFLNALDADGFDTDINPVVIEPVVQFTLYLKVKYEIEQAAGK